MKKNKNNEDLNKIFDDISFIKENIEINLRENKVEQNNFNANYNQFMLNNMERMKPTKLYKCQNCNCCFMFNECFDIQNNKAFDEHNFKLEKVIENQNENLINKNEIMNNNNKEEINEIEENNINEKDKDKKQDINNDVDVNTKKIEEKKDEKKEENKEKNVEEKDEKKEDQNAEEEKKEKKEEEKENKEEEKENNEEEKEKEDIEEVFKFQSVLQNYFFNENEKLKRFYPNKEELDEINTYYKSIYGKIDIQSYQESFLENLNNEISKIKDRQLLFKVNGRGGRIDKLRYLLENFLDEEKYGKFNNKKRYHFKNYRK